MISPHWSRPHEPTERDLRLFDILARQAADLIERKRAEEELRESEVWLADQRKALETALNGGPLETALGILARTATAVMGGAVRAAFYLANPTEQRFTTLWAWAPNTVKQWTASESVLNLWPAVWHRTPGSRSSPRT
jgi:hypothetical protein